MKWLNQLIAYPHSLDRVQPEQKASPKGRDYSQFVAYLTDKGVAVDQAVKTEARLIKRDNDRDDRTLCFECSHLKGFLPYWKCAKPVEAGISYKASEEYLGNLVSLFQRCDAFKPVFKRS
ncbi:MAG: hypothetical protein WCO72_07915 [Betaproteobacteria bacterium]